MATRYSSKISSKGQLTLPIAIRRRLGLRTGDRVEFVTEGERTVVRPEHKHVPSFRESAGILSQVYPGGAAEVGAWIRDLRDEGE